MGFPRLPGGQLWTHSARSPKIQRAMLGESFNVPTIVHRLQPIVDGLQERCEGRPLRVVSICDGVAGLLAALLTIDGWENGITYVAIEIDIDCRRLVRSNCDRYSHVTLRQLPQCSDAEAGRCCSTKPKCDCGDLLRLIPSGNCGFDGAQLYSYIEAQAGGPIDLMMSGYPVSRRAAPEPLVAFLTPFAWSTSAKDTRHSTGRRAGAGGRATTPSRAATPGGAFSTSCASWHTAKAMG